MFSIFAYVMSRVTHSEPGLPMLCDANYDRKNNDSTNALRPRRFK